MRKHKQTQDDAVNAGDPGEQRRVRGPRGGGGGAWGSQQQRKDFFFNKAVQMESRKMVEVGAWSWAIVNKEMQSYSTVLKEFQDMFASPY